MEALRTVTGALAVAIAFVPAVDATPGSVLGVAGAVLIAFLLAAVAFESCLIEAARSAERLALKAAREAARRSC